MNAAMIENTKAPESLKNSRSKTRTEMFKVGIGSQINSKPTLLLQIERAVETQKIESLISTYVERIVMF